MLIMITGMPVKDIHQKYTWYKLSFPPGTPPIDTLLRYHIGKNTFIGHHERQSIYDHSSDELLKQRQTALAGRIARDNKKHQEDLHAYDEQHQRNLLVRFPPSPPLLVVFSIRELKSHSTVTKLLH